MHSRIISLAILSTLSSFCFAQAPDAYCPPRPATVAEQEVIWEEFYTTLYVKRDPQTAFTRHVWTGYIEHNPFGGQGRQAALDFLVPFWPTIKHTLVNRAFANGYGWVHNREDFPNAPGRQPDAVIDVMRMNGTCIVEHWDTIQTKPANATNPNAMF